MVDVVFNGDASVRRCPNISDWFTLLLCGFAYVYYPLLGFFQVLWSTKHDELKFGMSEFEDIPCHPQSKLHSSFYGLCFHPRERKIELSVICIYMGI